MSPLPEVLRKAVASRFVTATQRFFSTEQKDPHAGTRVEIVLQQLAFLQTFADETPKHKLSNADLPFDQFLLRFSQRYLSTRKIAHKLGIKLVPSVVSLGRSLTSFSAVTAEIEFSPLNAELRWVLYTINPIELRLPVLQDMKKFTSCVFHELNHCIFFRLLRPTGNLKDRKSIQRYFTLVEALVILKDMSLADELGPLGYPLKTLGVVYRNSSWVRQAPKTMSFEEFHAYFAYVYLSLMNWPGKEILQQLKALGVSVPRHPSLETHREFIDLTHSQWTEKYFAKYGNRLVLPKKERGALSISFKKKQTDLKFVMDRKFLSKIHVWTEGIFKT